MSVAPLICPSCGSLCLFEGLGQFPPGSQETYAVAWRCTACKKRNVDVCNLGPLVPTPDSCLNCPTRYRNESGECPGCGLTVAQARSFFGLDQPGSESLAAAQEAFDRRLYRRGHAILNA